MSCNIIYQEYHNQIVEVTFRDGTDAAIKYGTLLIGYFYYPQPDSSSFFVTQDDPAKFAFKGQLIKLAFKPMPGFIMKYGISKEIENSLMSEGFLCSDVKKIISFNEIELELIGNTNFYLQNKERHSKSYSVSGKWISDYSMTKLKMSNGNNSITINGDQFYSFCNKIRECNLEDVSAILLEYNLPYDLSNNIFEKGLIKALCNSFVWLEYYLLDTSFLDNSTLIDNDMFLPKLYDEFILDFKQEPGVVGDMYLLKKSYQDPKSVEYCDRLVDRNLLCKLKLKIRGERFENYFVPFMKVNHDLEYGELFNFYKRILDDRNKCIETYFNK